MARQKQLAKKGRQKTARPKQFDHQNRARNGAQKRRDKNGARNGTWPTAATIRASKFFPPAAG